MRRLAKQDREDAYASQRDYQEILEEPTDRLATDGVVTQVRFLAELEGVDEDRFGFGVFLRADTETKATFTIDAGGDQFVVESHFGPEWKRIGFAFELSQKSSVTVDCSFEPAPSHIDLWGLSIDQMNFPARDGAEEPSLDELNVSHLQPETLYLVHSGSIAAGIEGAEVLENAGELIQLKKCSYCGRTLPLGPGQAGRLSFHKHNAKVSGHQNECRACKKWRINDTFNPLRTVDQLNESSVITRERKVLLREPEVLQNIKEREGRGLKSIVWDKFGKRCFYCDKPLELSDVQLDHTRPLAYLWPIDEHATCLCAQHNNEKKDKFPVDFYNGEQLKRLSEITGLQLDELQAKGVCEPQLERIRSDIAGFASNCDPRTFNAIARKVAELMPEVELWSELEQADRSVFEAVRDAQALRPGKVGDMPLSKKHSEGFVDE